MKQTTIRTKSRLYYARCADGGLWSAHFQPINPKTGKAWQAVRHLTGGEDCYMTGKYGERVSFVMGQCPPANSVRAAGNDWACAGFSTEALAIQRIREHMAAAKLVEVSWTGKNPKHSAAHC